MAKNNSDKQNSNCHLDYWKYNDLFLFRQIYPYIEANESSNIIKNVKKLQSSGLLKIVDISKLYQVVFHSLKIKRKFYSTKKN